MLERWVLPTSWLAERRFAAQMKFSDIAAGDRAATARRREHSLPLMTELIWFEVWYFWMESFCMDDDYFLICRARGDVYYQTVFMFPLFRSSVMAALFPQLSCVIWHLLWYSLSKCLISNSSWSGFRSHESLWWRHLSSLDLGPWRRSEMANSFTSEHLTSTI